MIRHGDPDYSACVRGGINGQGFGLVPLSEKGLQQARQVAAHPALAGAQLVLSSPYTRALQTAAEIVRATGLPLAVESDLHELMADRSGAPHTREEMKQLHQEFLACRGRWPEGDERPWETVEQLTDRVTSVLSRYLSYDKVIVVTHGGVIRRFVKDQRIAYCMPYVVPMEGKVECRGWIDVPEDISQ